MTAVPRSFDRLLWVLHLGSVLAFLGLVLATLFELWCLVSLLPVLNMPELMHLQGSVLPSLPLMILAGMLGALAFRHLVVASKMARVAGPFDERVSAHLLSAGRRFLLGTPVFWLTVWSFSWGLPAQGVSSLPWFEVITPAGCASAAVGLSLPLLLIALAHWLREGHQLQHRLQETV
ncbi:hypothetical protein [Deinococcus aquaedulcis]|uniref:hypothetical protein n=1 Tax=Deinococcus aquaedulcis TaxID=2840455 RepID=UPI001C829870|nr:hypothetical protein [Deinococcus aquaedulcis]